MKFTGRQWMEKGMHFLGIMTYILVVFLPLGMLAEAGQDWVQTGASGLFSMRRLDLLARSAGLALAVTLGANQLGTLAALFLWRWSISRPSLRWLIFLLAPLPPYIHAMAWMALTDSLGLPTRGLTLSIWMQIMAFLPLATALAPQVQSQPAQSQPAQAQPQPAQVQPTQSARQPAEQILEEATMIQPRAWLLKLTSGPSKDKTIPLAERLTIGRSAENDLVIGDSLLSRKHAIIERAGEAYQVSDLGSANGTFVNGSQISQPTRLKPGDVVRIGDTQIVLSGPAGLAPAALPEATRLVQDLVQPARPHLASPPALTSDAASAGCLGGRDTVPDLRRPGQPRQQVLRDVRRAGSPAGSAPAGASFKVPELRRLAQPGRQVLWQLRV